MMRDLLSICVIAVSAAGITAGAAVAADVAMPTKAPVAVAVVQGWSYSLNTEFQYYSWTSNRGFPTINDPTYGNPGSGWQVYVPTALSMSGLIANDTKLDFVARTGVVSSGLASSISSARSAPAGCSSLTTAGMVRVAR